MILTNGTSRQISFDLPTKYGLPKVSLAPGGSHAIPDDEYFAIKPLLDSLGLTVAQDGSGGAATTIIDNLTAATVPTATDDMTLGYGPGSHWLNATTQTMFVNSNAASGAAVWNQVGAGVKNNYAAIVAPTATDDSAAGYSVGSVWVDTIANVSYTCTSNAVGAAVWSNNNAIGTPLASTFDTITPPITIAAGAVIGVPTVNLGVDAATFNGSTVVVLLNGLEQVKGMDVLWSSSNGLTFTIDIYNGDVIVVKP